MDTSERLLSPTLGRVIRIARTEKGMSQATLAEKVETIQSTISLWENGRARPRVPQLLALAEALDVELTALLDAVRMDEARS